MLYSPRTLPWHTRHFRGLIYAACGLSIIGVGISCVWDAPNWSAALIAARQLYGLWALGLLIGTMTIGPLLAVFPRIPLKSQLAMGRRALGICSSIFALFHTACYLVPTLLKNWRLLYQPGAFWIVGLVFGLVAAAIMLALAVTSRDRVVVSMTPKRWKKLHRTIYILLPLTIIHSVFVGSDFGVNHAPDVSTEPDMGALIGFSVVSAAWLILFVLRLKKKSFGHRTG